MTSFQELKTLIKDTPLILLPFLLVIFNLVFSFYIILSKHQNLSFSNNGTYFVLAFLILIGIFFTISLIFTKDFIASIFSLLFFLSLIYLFQNKVGSSLLIFEKITFNYLLKNLIMPLVLIFMLYQEKYQLRIKDIYLISTLSISTILIVMAKLPFFLPIAFLVIILIKLILTPLSGKLFKYYLLKDSSTKLTVIVFLTACGLIQTLFMFL